MTARFNGIGQLIEIELSDGPRIAEPGQTFEDTALVDVDLQKIETIT